MNENNYTIYNQVSSENLVSKEGVTKTNIKQ